MCYDQHALHGANNNLLYGHVADPFPRDLATRDYHFHSCLVPRPTGHKTVQRLGTHLLAIQAEAPHLQFAPQVLVESSVMNILAGAQKMGTKGENGTRLALRSTSLGGTAAHDRLIN